jgi:hypothetical protein
VEVYQPLESGAGAIWAVQLVGNYEVSVAVDFGARIADGDLLLAEDRGGDPGSFGYRMGTGSCDVSTMADIEPHPTPYVSPGSGTPLPSLWASGGALTVDLSAADEACAASEAGYVWAATSPDVGGGSVLDPLAGAGQMRLSGLTAIPVIFTRDGVDAPSTATGVFTEIPTDAPPTTAATLPTPDTVPGEETIWSTENGLGFSIDLPNDWVVQPSNRVEAFTAGPDPESPVYLGIGVEVPTPGLAGDSSFPLDLSELPLVADGYEFRGDGRAFIVALHGTGPNGEPTSDEGALFADIVSSITFAPWEPGEERDGLGAIAIPTGPIDLATFGVMNRYILAPADDPVGVRAFGPLPVCIEGGTVEVVGEVVMQTCNGGDGQPDGSPGTQYGADGGGLPEVEVIIAHDGTRLVPLV